MAEADAKKQQTEYIAIAVLVVIALFIGLSRFKGKKKDDEVFSRKQFNKRWGEVELLESQVPQEEGGVSYNTSIAKTPFKSPFDGMVKVDVAEEEDVILPELTLQGVVWNSPMPQALIDNEVYLINDVIEVIEGEAVIKIKVTDITRDGVSLRYKMKDFIIRP